MFKRMSVVICGLAVMLVTAGPAIAQGDAVADAATTAAVKTKLLGDTKVAGLNIDVDTKDNVVTLTGKVKTAAERTEAVRLARTTTGVKNVVNKLTVDPTYDKSDMAKAETKSTAKKTGDAIETGAKKTGDAVETGAKKTGEAGKKVGKETEKVAKETGANITDASITSAVKTKFLGDTKVPGLDINVDTNNHVVTLTGTVKTAASKAEAIRLAKTTTGVHSVVDKITIVP
jgi:hyperosmotically inducible periplasmic protein